MCTRSSRGAPVLSLLPTSEQAIGASVLFTILAVIRTNLVLPSLSQQVSSTMKSITVLLLVATILASTNAYDYYQNVVSAGCSLLVVSSLARAVGASPAPSYFPEPTIEFTHCSGKCSSNDEDALSDFLRDIDSNWPGATNHTKLVDTKVPTVHVCDFDFHLDPYACPSIKRTCLLRSFEWSPFHVPST